MQNEMLERQLEAARRSNTQTYESTSTGVIGSSDVLLADGSSTHDTTTRYQSSQFQQPSVDHTQTSQRLREPPTAGSDRTTDLSDATKGTPTEYFGESSTFNFVANVGSPNEGRQDHLSATQSSRPGPGERNASLAASSPSAPVFELLSGDCDDPFGLPSRFVADRLVDAYFKYRHPLNPYLHEGTFRQRYRSIWLSQDVGGEEVTQQSLAWFGLVNLVFAFGSDHANVTGRSAADRTRYFKRSKCLIFSGLLQMGTIELVQALLLMGQYLHGSLELNNCWTVVGLAIRTAQGLGLHLDPTRVTTDRIEQEVRKRVWWGCFVIDRVLGMKVGRPTMPDGPGVEVDMPLAVDDEFLSNERQAVQPSGIPSKLEYFNQVIPQCRLMEKILGTLYGGDGSGENRQKARAVIDPPRLLALSIQLDGELVAWQENLPSHLKPEAQALEWHFERQRNVLMMRFLHARHLIHRQTLLLYITHRVTDAFQQEIMRTCVKRCITAAYDSINQVRTLHRQNKLSSFWHNSHYVFAALGVLLVYQTVEPRSKTDIGLPPNLDIDQTIRQGLELLSRVGGQMHPLASRYVQSIQQLQARLHTLATSKNNPAAQEAHHAPKRTSNPAPTASTIPASLLATSTPFPAQAQIQQASLHSGAAQGIYPIQSTLSEVSHWTGFEDEFSNIESMLMDSTGWTGLMDDWSDNPAYARFTYNGFA